MPVIVLHGCVARSWCLYARGA